MRERKTTPRSKAGDSADAQLDALMSVLQGVYSQQAKENPTRLRTPERSIDDVVWNAVVIGHPNQFSDMPEVFSLGQRITIKLLTLNAIPQQATPYAPAILSGLLNYLWRSQNLAYLDPEMARGQAGTVKVAVQTLAKDWAPPTNQPWFKPLGQFPFAVDAALAKLDALAYEDIYKHLDIEMKKLQTLATAALKEVDTRHRAATPAAMAWLLGTIIQKNVFSPLDGSVPEDYSDRLNNIYNTLERSAEAAFMPWLASGFKSVRESGIDELQRWKNE
jgi:hypothetical protein